MIILLYSLIILFPININGAILTDPKRQWSFPIQYNVTNKKYENHIKEAIDEIVNHTCLNFTRNDSLSLNSPGIVFRFNTSVGCSSEKIGPDIDNKTNFINFNDYCISNKVFIQSLIFSALGAYPEQTRLDREKYIYIYYRNIRPGTDLTLFNETNSSTTSDYDTYYDYASVLQFYNLSFSARGGYTMGTTHEYGDVYRKMLGQKSFVTFDNYKLINRHFCNQTCNGTRFGACFSSGYPNPRKCEECLCPYPFEGKYCTKFMENQVYYSCPHRHIRAEKKPKTFSIYYKTKCFVSIISDLNTRIEFTIIYLRTTYFSQCTRSPNMIELKYKMEKEVVGLCFCGTMYDYLVVSKDNWMLLMYSGDGWDRIDFKIKSREGNPNLLHISQ